MRRISAVCFLIFVFAVASQATTVNFVTPTGSSIGGQPVNASATVTTGAGVVTITLTDAQPNPTAIAQLITDFQFVLSNPSVTTGTLATQAGSLIMVNDNGTVTGVVGDPM